VLDLVETLHPTPAVAGLPTEGAVRWIGRHEAQPRGWYAGPVGWFDQNGDGDFAVAIRSALIQREQAWVYAGAGIVHGSNAAAEYGETALKLRPMLEALGATP
jgi:menaquinone-specific isochorismate synthase